MEVELTTGEVSSEDTDMPLQIRISGVRPAKDGETRLNQLVVSNHPTIG